MWQLWHILWSNTYLKYLQKIFFFISASTILKVHTFIKGFNVRPKLVLGNWLLKFQVNISVQWFDIQSNKSLAPIISRMLTKPEKKNNTNPIYFFLLILTKYTGTKTSNSVFMCISYDFVRTVQKQMCKLVYSSASFVLGLLTSWIFKLTP